MSRCLVVSSSRRPVVPSSRSLVVSSSRRPVVSSSRRLVVSQSRCLVVSSSRRPVVSSSRCPAVSLSRCLVVPSSCWRASQSFSGVLSLSQPIARHSVVLSQSRASQLSRCPVVPSSRRPAITQSFTALPNLPKFSNLPKFPLSFFNFFTLQKYVKLQTINQITLSPKKKISHIFVYVEK